MRILSLLITAITATAGGTELVAAAELTPRQIYEETAPGVVYIDGHEDTGKGSAGTGFMVHPDGLVMTNAHVIINAETGKAYSRLIVVFKPPRVTGNADEDYANRTTAKVLAADRQLDLALLKIAPAATPLTVLKLQDPGAVSIGDWVCAIGHPENGGLWTLTTGVVSAEFDDFDKTKGKHVFQTEIGLNRGNSGGPLLDVDGRVVGINTAIARLAKDGFPITSISFSVKSDVIQHWLSGEGYSIASVAVPSSRKSDLSVDTGTKPVADTKAEPKVDFTADSKARTTQAPRMPAPTTEPFRTEVRPYSQDEATNKLRIVENDLENMAEEMQRPFRSGSR
jgi:serine protease Do